MLLKTKRMKLSQAVNSVAKLSLLRSHLVVRNPRAKMSLVDLAVSGVRLELSSRSSHRLTTILYLLLAQRERLGLEP